MRTTRLTKLSSMLVVALAASTYSTAAHAGPILIGFNNTKEDKAVPIDALLESSEMSGAQFGEDAAAMGLDAKAVKAADEALAGEKLSVGAHVYVSVDRRKKKVKVDAVGQAHISSSFEALMGMVPKGYSIEFKGKGLHFNPVLIKKLEGLAGMRITITGGNVVLTGNSVLNLKGSSLTINGGNFEVHDNAQLNLSDSSISVSGGNVVFRPSSTVVLDGSSFNFSGAELPPTKAEFTGTSGQTGDKSVTSVKAPTHAPLVAAGRIVISDSAFTSTTGFTWEPSSLVVFNNKAELVGVDALPGGGEPGDLGCNDGGACLRFRSRDKKYRSKSGTLTINIYSSESDGGYKVNPPSAGTDWATHLDALVDKSAEK